jgi:plastocyanin
LPASRRARWSSVEEIVAMARARAEVLTRGHRLEVELESELPVARVDASLIAEVLYSLIDNAAKYSPARYSPAGSRRHGGKHWARAGHIQAPGRSPRQADQRSIRSRTRHDHHLHAARHCRRTFGGGIRHREGGDTMATMQKDTQTATVEITDKGFEPSSLKLKAGVPAKVTFVRKTDETCAKEVVIKECKIERKLPLNEPVTVEFTPRRGEFTFACGMDMIKGKMIVE